MRRERNFREGKGREEEDRRKDKRIGRRKEWEGKGPEEEG